MIKFSRVFREKFTEGDAALVEGIFQKYFTGLIDRDVKVGYTSTLSSARLTTRSTRS